jgi:septum formation protein
MILDLLPTLATLRIVLASASPRRLELLEKLGLRVDVRPSAFSETLPKAGVAPAEYVRATARGKALDVVLSLESAADMVISSDTVVVSADDEVLEKPSGIEEAHRMLAALSGRTHCVLTAVCVAIPPAAATWMSTALAAIALDRVRVEPTPGGGTLLSFVETAEVTFAALPPALIDAYVRTPEPFDKAGGYGIQGSAAQFISGIRGDYYCVMGFPVHAFCTLLRALVGVGLWQTGAAALEKSAGDA